MSRSVSHAQGEKPPQTGPEGAPRGRAVTPRVVFVGTGGGAHPRRCHAAIAIQPNAQRVLLLDTAGGFEVVAGLQRAGISLGAITHIFLSHRHSDHLFGLEPLLLHIGLEAMWGQREAGEVVICGAPEVLDAARAVLDAVTSQAPQFIVGAGGRVVWQPIRAGERLPLWPDATLTAFTVDHVPEDETCLGCAVELADPGTPGDTVRLVYSGDTRPVDSVRAAARGAQLLIHEAGGLDGARERVERAGHSTAGDVARLAREAGVGRLFLFHVPSDAAVPAMRAEAREAFGGPVAVPEDGDAYPLFEPLPVPYPATGAERVTAGEPAAVLTAAAESPPGPQPAS